MLPEKNSNDYSPNVSVALVVGDMHGQMSFFSDDEIDDFFAMMQCLHM